MTPGFLTLLAQSAATIIGLLIAFLSMAAMVLVIRERWPEACEPEKDQGPACEPAAHDDENDLQVSSMTELALVEQAAIMELFSRGRRCMDLHDAQQALRQHLGREVNYLQAHRVLEVMCRKELLECRVDSGLANAYVPGALGRLLMTSPGPRERQVPA